MKIKAIETHYKGYKFRSRLEARWAVFFDSLGLKWEYEREGFDLGNSGYYLPDFYLKEWRMWIEVKPSTPTQEEISKFFALASSMPAEKDGKRREHTIICGSPWFPEFTLGTDGLTVADGYFALTVSGNKIDGRPLAVISSFAMTDGGNNIDIWPLYFDTEDGYIVVPDTIKPVNTSPERNRYMSLSLFHGFVPRMYFGRGVDFRNKRLATAYSSARSARFEHGESPR